jgi:hypothetical protein
MDAGPAGCPGLSYWPFGAAISPGRYAILGP